jgi:iron(III) transport system ATP-binding protein
MSGGQQQRVALARALAGGGDLILFDEPLSNIDAKVRDELREELLTLQQRLGFAALFVTHDQTEAMILGSRIVVLDNGKIAQIGKPEEIYYSPVSEYVARFIGETNSIVGTVTSITSDRGFIVRTTAGMVVGRSSDPNVTLGSDVVAVWRPEETTLSLNQPGKNSNQWLSNIRQRMFLGPTIEYLLDSEGFSLKALKFRTGGQYTGRVWASVEREAVTILRR